MAASAIAAKKFRVTVATRFLTPPVFKPSEHDLDAIATFVAAPIAPYQFLPLSPYRDAGAAPFVFQRFFKPIGF